MLQQYLMQQGEVILGWGFFIPLVLMVVLILLAVRIWVVIGIGSFAMLLLTEVLPPTLLGEALFDGIDSFALIAVPLFILTGDILVRTGLSGKLLDVAEATMGARRSGLNFHRAGLWFFCLYQRLRCRRCRGHRPNHHRPAGG